MTPADALALARAYDVSITVEAGRLILAAPRQPPMVVLDALRETKPALVAVLRAAASAPAEVIPFPPVRGCYCAHCAARRLVRAGVRR